MSARPNRPLPLWFVTLTFATTLLLSADALPSRDDVTKCLVDRDVVLTGVNPTLVPREASKKSRGERQERSA